jgi:creatinine amidohydrolase
MALVLVELARSADWARGVVLVNGHGGNADAVARAVGVLQSEGRSALAWWPPPFDDSRADAHAGWLETSLIAHLSARELRPGAVAAGNVAPLSDLAAALRKHGVHSVSATGVLGDPTGWSAADGARLFATMTTDLVARFDAWLG